MQLRIAPVRSTDAQITVRETDCFEKRYNEWQLIHQHASVPFGGDWDGKIIEA
jgi:ketosteroid isomerase-like protein